jgi:hypothetical protein
MLPPVLPDELFNMDFLLIVGGGGGTSGYQTLIDFGHPGGLSLLACPPQGHFGLKQ